MVLALTLIIPWPILVYLVMSILTFCVYAMDKSRARRGRWRISESMLQLLALLGGWPGAFLAQQTLRHKNHKTSFQMVFWIIVLVHLLFWAWWVGWIRF